MKEIKFILLLLFGLTFLGANAQTMNVIPITGTQTAYPVGNIQKLTFSGDSLVVTNTTGINGIFALADNRYLNFTDLTLGTAPNQIIKNSFYVYPNPTATVLNIANADKSQTISHLEIISLEGRVLMEQNAPQVVLVSLPQGMYFCRITSNNKTQTIKFLKQ